MIDPQAEDDLRAAIDERLAARLDDARRRRAAREQARAEKNARRTAGLRARHAAKLARLTDSPTGRDQDPQIQYPPDHKESLRASPRGGTYEQAMNRPAVFGDRPKKATDNEAVQRGETASRPETKGQPQDEDTTP